MDKQPSNTYLYAQQIDKNKNVEKNSFWIEALLGHKPSLKTRWFLLKKYGTFNATSLRNRITEESIIKRLHKTEL